MESLIPHSFWSFLLSLHYFQNEIILQNMYLWLAYFRLCNNQKEEQSIPISDLPSLLGIGISFVLHKMHLERIGKADGLLKRESSSK